MLHRGNEDDKATRILRPCFLMALGSPRDDNGKQYEYLQDSAIQQSVPDVRPVMQRHLTDYIAFCAITRV